MKITRIGRFLKMLRLEHFQNQKQMSETLGFTQTYVSGIESGRVSIPKGFKHKILDKYSLKAEQIKMLDDIIEHSHHRVTILTNDDELSIRMLNVIKEKIDSLSVKQKKEVLQIVAG